jgi:hypothetical protein
VAGQQPSHCSTKRRNAERFVDGGNVEGKFAYPTAARDIIHVKDGQSGKVLPHPGNELGTAETGHVVVGDYEIESGLSGAGCVQCRTAVGYFNDLEAVVGQSPGYQGPDHRLVVDYKNAVGQRPSSGMSVD